MICGGRIDYQQGRGWDCVACVVIDDELVVAVRIIVVVVIAERIFRKSKRERS